MAKLSFHAGPPVRLPFPGRIGSSRFKVVSALVLERVRGLVHYEIGVFGGKTLAFVTVQPLSDYSADDAVRDLRAIAQEVDGNATEQAAAS